MKLHRQCMLTKGTKGQMLWIPEKFAIVGKYIKLKGDDGWRVVKVYTKKPSREITKRQQDYLRQRKASDI